MTANGKYDHHREREREGGFIVIAPLLRRRLLGRNSIGKKIITKIIMKIVTKVQFDFFIVTF